MKRHIEPLLVAEPDEEIVDADHVIRMAGEGGPDDRGDTDRVLVDVGLDVLGPDRVLARLQGDDPRLDVEVAAELLPDDVHVASEDEVRPVGRLPLGLTPLAPLPLQRERAEHDRLGGALCPGPGGLARRIEQFGQHVDAALLDLGGHRILRVIDEVPKEVLVDHDAGLWLHPGGHERRQVSLWDPLHGQLLLKQPHRGNGGHGGLGDGGLGGALGEEGARGGDLDLLVEAGALGHRSLAAGGSPRARLNRLEFAKATEERKSERRRAVLTRIG
jgi:hypothetical protein